MLPLLKIYILPPKNEFVLWFGEFLFGICGLSVAAFDFFVKCWELIRLIQPHHMSYVSVPSQELWS